MITTRAIRVHLLVGLCLVGTACGSGSDDSTNTQATGTPATEPATVVTDGATVATDPPTVATEPPPATTEAPTTTVAPVPEFVPFDLADLVDLVALADQAVTDASIDPLDVAQRIIGFPFEIPVPDGSTLLRLDAGLTFGNADGNAFEFAYQVVAPGGVVPDIDINLDDNGPGSVEIIETWDPIMADLGFQRQNSTASDPGDPGGPNSVNHVYVPLEENQMINGVATRVEPLFIWSDEDINGGSFSSEDVLGGYRIGATLDAAFDAGFPIPLVNAVIDAFPKPDGLSVTDMQVRLLDRGPDSFSADAGLNYLTISIETEAPASEFDAIVDFYSTPTDVFTDETIVMAGDPFFSDEVIDRAEMRTISDTTRRLELLFLQRYGGALEIEAADPGAETMTVSLDFELNPNDTEFQLPTD